MISDKHTRHEALKQEWLERFLEVCELSEENFRTREQRSSWIGMAEMTSIGSGLVKPGVNAAIHVMVKLGFTVVHCRSTITHCGDGAITGIRFHWSDHNQDK